MNNAYAPNTRKTLERVNKRMKELPIEVFKSMEDLQQLPVRELKAGHPVDVTDSSPTMPTAFAGNVKMETGGSSSFGRETRVAASSGRIGLNE